MVLYEVLVFPAWRGWSGETHPALWSLCKFTSRRQAHVYFKHLQDTSWPASDELLRRVPHKDRIRKVPPLGKRFPA